MFNRELTEEEWDKLYDFLKKLNEPQKLKDKKLGKVKAAEAAYIIGHRVVVCIEGEHEVLLEAPYWVEESRRTRNLEDAKTSQRKGESDPVTCDSELDYIMTLYASRKYSLLGTSIAGDASLYALLQYIEKEVKQVQQEINKRKSGKEGYLKVEHFREWHAEAILNDILSMYKQWDQGQHHSVAIRLFRLGEDLQMLRDLRFDSLASSGVKLQIGGELGKERSAADKRESYGYLKNPPWEEWRNEIEAIKAEQKKPNHSAAIRTWQERHPEASGYEFHYLRRKLKKS